MFNIPKTLIKHKLSKSLTKISNMSNKAMSTFNKSGVNYEMATFNPDKLLKGHTPVVKDDQLPEYNITELNNGFSVLTEKTIFPGPVNISFLMDVGTRDETQETSGACLALKNTYLKTIKDANQTVKDGKIQMSGDSIDMEYDQEKIYFSGTWHEYNASDKVGMMLDLALKPKSENDVNSVKMKNYKNHEAHDDMIKIDPFMDNTEILVRTAYGETGLGMPLLGHIENVENINSDILHNFLTERVNPKKWIIAANNVNNHQEFVDLWKDHLSKLTLLPEHKYTRETSKYNGGDFRIKTETPTSQILVAYESCKWTDSNLAAYFVMNTLIGSAQSFSVGGPGKGMYWRAITNLMQRYAFVESAGAINSIFSDSGLFGMMIEGPALNGRDIMFLALQELHRLREPIPDEELSRARNILKMNILQSLERDEDRLEEMTKNYATYGTLTFSNYLNDIDNVSSDKINRIAFEMLKTRPTIVVAGSEIDTVQDASEIHKLLNG